VAFYFALSSNLVAGEFHFAFFSGQGLPATGYNVLFPFTVETLPVIVQWVNAMEILVGGLPRYFPLHYRGTLLYFPQVNVSLTSLSFPLAFLLFFMSWLRRTQGLRLLCSSLCHQIEVCPLR
jgi:hypothetical protein